MSLGFTTKGMTFPPEILTSDEVRALMNVASRRGVCGVRDRAMIATMYRAGLRVSEALALQPKDVDLATGAIQVLHGKGDKARTVGVDPETIALLEVWLAKRSGLGLNGRHPLFCTLSGGKMSRVQFTQRLKALAAKAGIEKRVHPHGLRHSRAVDLVRNGTPLPIIQRAYGHTSLQTTQTYVSHIAPVDVIEAMQRGTW